MWQRQEGLVSFLVVMFISILLVLISAGFAQVMIRELRQSTDNELSVKAFYEAEAGIEDGLLRIKQAIETGNITAANQSSCVAAPSSATTGYSCRLITVEPQFLEGTLQADESRQFNLEGVNHTSIVLRWHEHASNYDTGSGMFNIPVANPPAGSWPVQTPPIMRVEVVSYPTSGNLENQIEQRVAFLRPANNTTPTPGINVNSLAPPGGNTVRTANCDRTVTGSFACGATFTGMSTDRHYIVRIRPFYNRTNYRLEAIGASGAQAIPGNTAIIDVTGYAGDVYRRVQMRIPLYSIDTFGQDYVILTDDDLCKVMRVSEIEDRASTNTGCEP